MCKISHIRYTYDLIRLMDNLKSLDYQETTVQWEEWGLSDDDASESEYAAVSYTHLTLPTKRIV